MTMEATPGHGRIYPGREEGLQRTSYEELLSICLKNTANAFQAFAITGTQGADNGAMISMTESEPSLERYQLCVFDLSVHILDRHKTESVKGLEAEAWKEWESTDDPHRNPCRLRPFAELHHAIVELVEEKSLLAGKVRRELVSA